MEKSLACLFADFICNYTSLMAAQDLASGRPTPSLWGGSARCPRGAAPGCAWTGMLTDGRNAAFLMAVRHSSSL